jgi:hypothetical protein
MCWAHGKIDTIEEVKWTLGDHPPPGPLGVCFPEKDPRKARYGVIPATQEAETWRIVV